ncbi:MAG: DUF6178 family protein [Syntrophobacteraceae bacterium]|nr:DUF6178 family protein [Desulfobacteraceae bacterium]
MGIIDLEGKRLERLGPAELAGQLMRLPARKRLETILQRADAEAVVKAMAVQDFYFSVQELGPDDALALLSLAGVDQLTYLFDLEWWQKDRTNPARAIEWLERLATASEDKLLAWLYEVDFELLVTMFKQWIDVGVAPEETDPMEAVEYLPKNTLDDLYYWEARYPQHEEFLKSLLSVLFEVNPSFYRELLHHVMYWLDAEAEESAYRFHRGRLEDHAIPDFYDAMEIYRAIRPEDVIAGKRVQDVREEEAPSPAFAVSLVPEKDLLGRALGGIQDAAMLDMIQLELASLANKVVVADEVAADNPAGLRDAVDKVAAYVNLGLDLKSAGSVDEAVGIVSGVYLEQLFRLGHAQVARLRARMKQVLQRGWLAQWPTGLGVLESEWMDEAEALLRKTPRMLRAATADGPRREDFFRDRRDLFQGKNFIDTVISLGMLVNGLGATPGSLDLELWPDGQIHGAEDVTAGAMIWTAAARSVTDGKWEVVPIPVEDWEAVFPLLQENPLEDRIRSWVEKTVSQATQRNLLWAYLEPLCKAWAEDSKLREEGGAPDPRFVRLLLFTSR